MSGAVVIEGYPLCERCHGTGEIEIQVGGNGYAVSDVPCVCPECEGSGRES